MHRLLRSAFSVLSMMAVGGVIAATGCNTDSDSGLTISTVRGEQSDLYANYTIVAGSAEAMVIDMPFTRSGAQRLTEEIRTTGKELRYIFVTHPHPDHYFGASVLLDEFPDAQYHAVPTVAEAVERSIQPRIEAWGEFLGPEGPGEDLPAPVPYHESTVSLDGGRVQILGPLHGDVHDSTAFHIPSLDAVVGGDILFNGIDLFFAHYGTAQERQSWAAAVDQLAALEPEIVIPGHSAPALPNDESALHFTRDYLRAFEDAVAAANGPDDIVTTMIQQFPDAIDLGGMCILRLSALVAMGVIPPAADDSDNPDIMIECDR